jgi:hypothetical protein
MRHDAAVAQSTERLLLICTAAASLRDVTILTYSTWDSHTATTSTFTTTTITTTTTTT